MHSCNAFTVLTFNVNMEEFLVEAATISDLALRTHGPTQKHLRVAEDVKLHAVAMACVRHIYVVV